MALNSNMRSLRDGLIETATRGMTLADLRRLIRRQEKLIKAFADDNADGRNSGVIANLTETLNAYRDFAERVAQIPTTEKAVAEMERKIACAEGNEIARNGGRG